MFHNHSILTERVLEIYAFTLVFLASVRGEQVSAARGWRGLSAGWALSPGAPGLTPPWDGAELELA